MSAPHSPLPARSSVGLCWSCRHSVQVVSSRGQEFWQCRRSADDPGFPKYPRLPVIECRGYESRGDHGRAGESP